MTAIQVTCPGCSKAYTLKPELAGKSAKCKCGARIQIPELAASHESEELELEPPLVSVSPPTLPPIVSAPTLEDGTPIITTKRKKGGAKREKTSVAGLKFVGICGFVIMGAAVLIGLANTAFGFHLAVQARDQMEISLFIFFLVVVQALIWYAVFRLGQALVNSEKSAVHGLMVIYVLILVTAGAIAYTGYSMGAVIAAVAASVLFLPPIVVGYLNWDGFYDAQ